MQQTVCFDQIEKRKIEIYEHSTTDVILRLNIHNTAVHLALPLFPHYNQTGDEHQRYTVIECNCRIIFYNCITYKD